ENERDAIMFTSMVDDYLETIRVAVDNGEPPSCGPLERAVLHAKTLVSFTKAIAELLPSWSCDYIFFDCRDTATEFQCAPVSPSPLSIRDEMNGLSVVALPLKIERDAAW